MFTDREIDYLSGQGTGRIATVSPSQQPDVAPVGYAFDGQAFTIRGINVEKTLKYRNVARGGDRAAFVVDDYETDRTGWPGPCRKRAVTDSDVSLRGFGW